MANKQHLTAITTRSRFPILLFTFFLLALSILFLLFSFSPTHTRSAYPDPTFSPPAVKPETSFVASLEHFLIHEAPRSSPDDTAYGDDVRTLDEKLSARESERVDRDTYYPLQFPIRVYVYAMPRKFTYDLLWLFRNTYKETDNLTSNGSPVHRLIEQHSIDYWLWVDLIAPESERLLKSVVRVHRQEEADLFYIPFFTTISFFLLEKQQCKALYRV
uniref:Uncharacterized protein MANES_09G126700 n=1 Tax=Rhizophora mucronata TaxID=61149 RepID=A0A2P2QE75_RHIMU